MKENNFEVIGISSPGEALEEVQKTEGINTIAIEMKRTISPIADLKALLKLIQLFRTEKPNIVHTHTPKAGLLGMLAAKITMVPHRLHTVAGMPLIVATGFKRKVLNLTEKLTYTCATKVYPNSYGLMDFIVENKFTNLNKLKVIGNGSSNGIDTSEFDPSLISEQSKQNLKKSLGIADDDFVFIFVGRLVGDKGINELIKAFKDLLSEKLKFNSKLLLVGPFENELDPLLPETLLEIQDNNYIISVGAQKDVRPYFAISDCLAFPSYREGFPNVVMQAGAMGLPSIVTNINGCNEIIQHHQNGLIIPVKDANALENAMRQLVEDEILYQILQHEARSKIVNNYEQQVVWTSILAEYKKQTDHV